MVVVGGGDGWRSDSDGCGSFCWQWIRSSGAVVAMEVVLVVVVVVCDQLFNNDIKIQ